MKKFLWFLLEGLNLSQFGGISPQVRVVLQAEAPLDDLFVQEHHDDHDHHDTHVLLDDLGISRVIYKLFAIQVLWELNKEPFFFVASWKFGIENVPFHYGGWGVLNCHENKMLH